jgi:hypothetical protein
MQPLFPGVSIVVGECGEACEGEEEGGWEEVLK